MKSFQNISDLCCMSDMCDKDKFNKNQLVIIFELWNRIPNSPKWPQIYSDCESIESRIRVHWNLGSRLQPPERHPIIPSNCSASNLFFFLFWFGSCFFRWWENVFAQRLAVLFTAGDVSLCSASRGGFVSRNIRACSISTWTISSVCGLQKLCWLPLPHKS